MMLKEIGEWTRINGAGIYVIKAWVNLGEGSDGKLKVLPGGKLGRKQAEHLFFPTDIRLTVGKEGNLYAYCMTVPATGTAFSLKLAAGQVKALHREQTPYQMIEIFDAETFGKLMVIDGCTLVSTRDNFLYHEMVSHPALFTHPNPKRVVIIGGGDCAVRIQAERE